MRGGRLAARLGLVAGLVLLVIGVRFMLWPESAALTFGLGRQATVGALSAVVGLRDLWLALLALAFAWLKEWRALALWLALGAGVCAGDAAVVLANAGPASGSALSPWSALLFHMGSGVFCAGLAWHCWQLAGSRDKPGG